MVTKGVPVFNNQISHHSCTYNNGITTLFNKGFIELKGGYKYKI
jgi:hypothetical protein